MLVATNKALAASLIMSKFMFDARNDRLCYQNDSENELAPQNVIVDCLKGCNICVLEPSVWYRTRKILENDKDIVYDECGIPIKGYPADKSGVAPAENIEKAGRGNDSYEQVLYVAEDIETSIMETRVNKREYASVAHCTLGEKVSLFDFSPYTEDELIRYSEKFLDKDKTISDGYLFIEMQRILTLPDYSVDEYIISRSLVKFLKNYFDVSGVMYISHFTGRKNLAIWDDNRNVPFTDGTVMHVI